MLQPIFTPLNLYGMFAWYDAATLTAGSISTWSDLSGNGNNAVAGVAPTCVAASMNNKNVLRFNGSTQYLAATLSTNITTTTLTYFIVAKRITAIANNSLINFVGAGQANDFDNAASITGLWEGSSSTALNAYRSGTLSTIANPGNGVAYIATELFDGANNTLYYNNAARTPVATSGSFNIHTIYMGARWQSSTLVPFWNGDIAEIIIYNRILSTTEITAVNQYLSNKWSIAI